ncbi:MAG: FHA domain-containing protein [Bacteroidota bacterium]
MSIDSETVAIRPSDGKDPETILLTPAEVARELAFLVVVSGRRMGTCYRLERPRSLIGRSSRVQIYLDDPRAGGEHASIRCEKVSKDARGEFVLRDLDSETGTFVNGKRIATVWVLKDGDLIRIGDMELVFKRV